MMSDALNAGVQPGGLRTRLEIRVLLCYILKMIKEPAPLEPIKEMLHFEGVANYFETAFAIAELEDNGIIISTDDDGANKLYCLSESKYDALDFLFPDLPFSVRENALNIAKNILKRRKNERENNVLIEQTNDGVYVECSCMEKERKIVSVRLLVPDLDTANSIKERFLEEPIKLLISATSALTGNDL